MDKSAEFTGKLNFISMPDIFQFLGGNGSTGVLHVTTQYAPDKGLIYFIKGNPVNAKCGSLSGIKAAYSLFGWTEGNFEFYEQDVEMGQTIKQNRMEIVLDALRMVDDGEIKKVGPPSFDEQIWKKMLKMEKQRVRP